VLSTVRFTYISLMLFNIVHSVAVTGVLTFVGPTGRNRNFIVGIILNGLC